MMNECDAGASVGWKVVVVAAAIVTAAVVQRNRGARNHCAEQLVVVTHTHGELEFMLARAASIVNFEKFNADRRRAASIRSIVDFDAEYCQECEIVES